MNRKNKLRAGLSIAFIWLWLAFTNGQSFTDLQSNYSGRVTWDASGATVTFTASGTIYFADKVGDGTNPETDQKQNFWDVPVDVSTIVIEAGVTVTGAFHTFSNCMIRGVDRKTSVVYGTPLERWADANNPGGIDLKEWYYAQFQNQGGVLTVRNLTCLNPFSYFIRGWNTVNHLKSVDFIDDRGGWGNHSDGFSGGHGSTIDSCYFETGDDAIKCYFDITVTNTTIKMIQNCVPFQFGWGSYQDSHTVLRNITITGTEGRGAADPVFQWVSGSDHKTVLMTGCNIQNPNATLFELKTDQGTLDLDISNSFIKVRSYKAELLAGGTRTICGSTEEKNTYDCLSTVLPVPGLVEAEDYTNMSGIGTEPTTDTSGVENITGIDADDWLEYELDVQQEGDYTLGFRIASETERIGFELLMGSRVLTVIEEPATGGGEAWSTVSGTLELPAGIQKILLRATTGDWKLNWMEFKKNPILGNVEDLRVLVRDHQSLDLFWTEDVPDETGFLIERSLAGQNNYDQVDTVDANQVTYTDSIGLSEFTLYAYRVRTLYSAALSQATESVMGRTAMETHADMPAPWSSQSFGDTRVAMASTSYVEEGTFTLDVGDGDFWTETDRGHMVYQVRNGDCEIIAKIDEYTHAQAYTMAGVMIRDSLDGGSKLAGMMMISDPGAIVRARFQSDGPVDQEINNTGETAPYWLRLKREGDWFTGFVSPDRISWRSVRKVNLSMAPEVYVGLAATSHTTASPALFTFTNVQVGDPKNEFLVSASSGANGSISPSGNLLVLEGTNLDFTITPDKGYYVKEVILDGGSLGGMERISLENIDAAHNIQAVFELIVSRGYQVAGAPLFIYPNPALDYITLEQEGVHKGTLTIYSMDGQVRISTTVEQAGSSIDVSALHRGVYILVWNTGEHKLTRKICIQ